MQQAMGRWIAQARAGTLALLMTLAPATTFAQASTEMVAGTNDVTTTTPTLGPVTVTLQNNSDNPTGNTFVAIAAPAPTASLTISNLQYATAANFATNGVYIGNTAVVNPAAGTFPRFAPMNIIGAGADSMFTSLPTVTGGTGLTIVTNRVWYLQAPTLGPSTGGAPRSGRIHLADAIIDVSVPMSNVALHVVGLGGNAADKNFTVELDLLPAQSIGATGVSRLSGTTSFAVSGNQINNTASAPAGSCGTGVGACGSVHVTGTAVTRIALRIYIRSPQATAWSTTGGDTFMIGLSGEVSDLLPTLGTIPATIQPGETYYGLTASCVNNGPNTARGGLCTLSAATGTVSNLACTGFTAGALVPGGTATCTYDYTAPLSGSGVGSTAFTGTTGAPNDRNGGTSTGGNNSTATVTRTLTDSPFAPAQPAGICSAVADRLTFSFTGVAGGTEAGSYDLISRSPFSYNTSGKPVFMTGSGAVSTQTVATTPGVLFQPTELTTAALPTTATTGTGEIVIITSRVVGRSGSAMTVRVSDSGQADHDVFTIETAAGAMLARTPASGSNSTDGDLTLAFTMPADGFVFLRQYIADYGASYGQRLDGGCLRTNLVTVKSRTSAASVEVGQTATFSITVTNSGPSDASNIRLTDLMPTSLSGVTAVPSTGSYNASTGLWTLGGLANGGTATLTLTATATMAASNTTVTNTTTAAAGDQTDPTTAADVLQASVTVLQAAQVNATKTITLLSNSADGCASRSSTPDVGVEAFVPGSCVEYVIGLSNPTASVARDIRMTDVLATGLTFIGATASGFDTSDPAYALTAPASGTACGGAACTVLLDKARLAANATGQVRIRAVLP